MLSNLMASPFPKTEEILEKLVSFETVNGNEAECAHWIADLLRFIGMNVIVQDLGSSRANVFAYIGDDARFLLCGHLDVVPAAGSWLSHPFTLRKTEERYYGRGCADMKGAIAAMIAAAYRFLHSSETIQNGFALLFVADEEKDNLGTRCFLEQSNNDFKYCVIGEPTELQIAIAHKGVARFYVTVHGKSAHSSLATQGRNAIEGAALLVEAIKIEDIRLKVMRHPILSPPSINVTVLHAGEQDNIIPGEAKMIIDYRVSPGTSYEDAYGLIDAVTKKIKSQAPGFDFSIKKHHFSSGGELALDNEFVVKSCNVAKSVFGQGATPKAFQATCEQYLFNESGIDTIICGPGNLSQAHAVDEFIAINQLEKAVILYQSFISHFNK